MCLRPLSESKIYPRAFAKPNFNSDALNILCAGGIFLSAAQKHWVLGLMNSDSNPTEANTQQKRRDVFHRKTVLVKSLDSKRLDTGKKTQGKPVHLPPQQQHPALAANAESEA